jgi:cystathionine beta-lyase/cystathionine gamma-synthase
MENKHKFPTLAIHAGEEERFSEGAVTAPVYQTSTFVFRNSAEVVEFQKGDASKYLYTRYGNPTLRTVENKMAALEGGEAALVVSSGMAAVSTLALTLVSTGEEIISTEPVYGGTFHLFKETFARMGIKVHFVDPEKIEQAEALLNPKTKLFFCETPTNPNLKIVDIRRLAKMAAAKNVPVAVDNTFATPYNQNPLSLGADLVIHSATKYLAGHSDLVAGVIIGSKKVVARAVETMKLIGCCIDPLGAFLLLRGLKTLAVRVQRQNENALKVAQYLSGHQKVIRVSYPGLPGFAQHELAKSQMRGFGGMVCFEVQGGLEAATKVIDGFELFANATSLGGVESLASLPVLTSHYGFDEDELTRADVTTGMVRLSCGIEDAEDLIGDLKQALEKIR